MENQVKQLTKEEAIAFYDNKLWEDMDYKQRAIFQVTQDRLCMPFDVFHESIEKALGRSVFTHEFGLNREGLMKELLGEKEPPTFDEIVNMIPKEKLLGVLIEN